MIRVTNAGWGKNKRESMAMGKSMDYFSIGEQHSLIEAEV